MGTIYLPNKKKPNCNLKSCFMALLTLFHFVDNQNTEETIENFKKSTPIDLIVMLRYKHTFFEKLVSGSSDTSNWVSFAKAVVGLACVEKKWQK